MKSTEITDINKCTGCSLCESICPTKCISMRFSEEGFRYPSIDESICIDCGACQKKCPVNAPVFNNPDNTQKALLAKNKDKEVYYKSSSGGVFYELARTTIEDGGIVFGASWDDNFICRHICIDNTADIDRLLGSKYVQSDTSGIWKTLKREVASGRKVLFSGTPCQIGAARSLYHTIPDNLLLVEVICMGVPSPMMFDAYLHDIGKRVGSPVVSASFRDKKYFGESRMQSLIIKNRSGIRYARTRSNDPYFDQFLRCNSLRESCYQCSFKSAQRAADITLGDCWGMQEIAFSELKARTVSLIIANTPSGNSAIDSIRSQFDITGIPMSLVKENQPMLTVSCPPGPLRQTIFKNAPFGKATGMYDYLKKASGFGYKQAVKSWLLHLKYGIK